MQVHAGLLPLRQIWLAAEPILSLEQGVAEIGGLYVMGTTRHQSRRIDRQLRGRCARQGDPGTSKFYISFEDSLLRLFASPRITSVLQRFRPPEGEPISARMLNKSIETAQKRVEQRNYMIRKHTLEYDDVMNKQRQEIYSFRNEVLTTEKIENLAEEVIASVCLYGAEKFFNRSGEEASWNPEGYRQWLMHLFPITFEPQDFESEHLDIEEIAKLAEDKVVHAFKEKMVRENSKAPPQLLEKNGPPRPAHHAVRNLMIRKIDQMWQEHLLHMDHLRSDVTLRAVGQRDPLTEFKHEAFALFDELGNQLRMEIGRSIFRFEIVPSHQAMQQFLQTGLRLETNRSLFADLQALQQPNPQENREGEPESDEEEEESRENENQKKNSAPPVGRNDLCPCGSGKKFKKCCQPD